MTGKEMERAIEFLTEHQARVSVDIERVSNDIERVSNDLERVRNDIDKVKGAQERTTANIDSLTRETREGFNNLIIANEVTRDLTRQVARLAVQPSQRVDRA